jgi:hypothetical protein
VALTVLLVQLAHKVLEVPKVQSAHKEFKVQEVLTRSKVLPVHKVFKVPMVQGPVAHKAFQGARLVYKGEQPVRKGDKGGHWSTRYRRV